MPVPDLTITFTDTDGTEWFWKLTEEEITAIIEKATLERRPPAAQASVLIAMALELWYADDETPGSKTVPKTESKPKRDRHRGKPKSVATNGAGRTDA
jgi:hypothetical protein